MESLMLDVSEIDMNNVINLTFYTQIIRFQMSPMEEETLFQYPDQLQQKAIHTWAQALGFDYEYSLASPTARVVRAIPSDVTAIPKLDDFEFFDFDSSIAVELAGDDLGNANADFQSMDVSHMEGPWSNPIIWPSVQASLGRLVTKNSSTQTDDRRSLGEEQAMQRIGLSQPLTVEAPWQTDHEEHAPICLQSSLDLKRGRSSVMGRLSRRQSVQSQRSSGYKEIIFDSGSSRVSSPAASGRRGPLDAAARVAMRAVTAVRACWRCKFLRKTCGPESPCARCPTRSTKPRDNNWNWPAVGCNRGSFGDVLPPLYLCPAQDPTYITTAAFLTDKGDPVPVNSLHQVLLLNQAETLKRASEAWSQTQFTSLYSYLRTLDCEAEGSLLKGFQISTLIPPSPLLVSFAPLEQCIAAVVYEAIESSHFITPILFSPKEQFDDFPGLLLMLHSAAKYQAKADNNELIAQSPICLRSGFEAFRMRNLSLPATKTHEIHVLCRPGTCGVDYIRSIDEHLCLFLDALSKVFFKKDNMRVKHRWWLSTFYSFIIQGVVRNILRQLNNTTNAESSTDQYLHLAIRLFIASSGEYDPLTRDYIALPNQKGLGFSYIQDIQEAKLAVKHETWAARDFASSADYLRCICEDDGKKICLKKDAASKRDELLAPGISSSAHRSTQSHVIIQRDAASPTQSPYSRPMGLASHPYRASSLSSMESCVDMNPPSIASPAQNDYRRTTFKSSTRFPSASPTASLTSQNASGRASPTPYLFSKPAPSQSSYYPGLSFAQGPNSFDLPQGTYHVPADVHEASRKADEKRARNAGASARFRQRRMDKEREAKSSIEKLQQRIRELEKSLSAIESERDLVMIQRSQLRELVSDLGGWLPPDEAGIGVTKPSSTTVQG